MERLRFTEPQERHVASTLKLVEQAVRRLEALLDKAAQGRKDTEMASPFTEEATAVLRSSLHQLSAAVQEVSHRHGFRPRSQNLTRILDAELSSMWEMLEDCRPPAMRGYGPMDTEVAARLENDMEKLIAAVVELRKFVLKQEAR